MTPQEQMIKLLHSYNPDLPMGEGMKAQFLALRDECDRSPVVIEKGWPEYEPPAGKKVGGLMMEVGFSGNKVSELVQFILDAVAEGGMTAECGEELGRHLKGLDVGEVSPDANVELNRKMLLDRSKVGLEKYGVTTERTDLTPAQWAQHAIEEALDFANYLQALKRNLEGLVELLAEARDHVVSSTQPVRGGFIDEIDTALATYRKGGDV